MQKIWEMAKWSLTTEEIKHGILLRTDREEGTPGILHHMGAN